MEDEKKEDVGQKESRPVPDEQPPEAQEGDWEDGYVGLDEEERKAVDDDEVLSNPG